MHISRTVAARMSKTNVVAPTEGSIIAISEVAFVVSGIIGGSVV